MSGQIYDLIKRFSLYRPTLIKGLFSFTVEVYTANTIRQTHPLGLLLRSHYLLAEAYTYTKRNTPTHIQKHDFSRIRPRDLRNQSTANLPLRAYGHRDRRWDYM